MEPLHEDFQVACHILSRLGLNFTCNTIQVGQVPLTESRKELSVVWKTPVLEASLKHGLVALF